MEDSTLVISSFYKITGKKKLQITVNYNYLSTLTVSAGDIRMQDAVRSDELFVRTSESAKLQLNAEASKIDILMEGNSSGDYTPDRRRYNHGVERSDRRPNFYGQSNERRENVRERFGRYGRYDGGTQRHTYR